jgi:hypothetical protein
MIEDYEPVPPWHRTSRAAIVAVIVTVLLLGVVQFVASRDADDPAPRAPVSAPAG